jgi:hypothetical protein
MDELTTGPIRVPTSVSASLLGGCGFKDCLEDILCNLLHLIALPRFTFEYESWQHEIEWLDYKAPRDTDLEARPDTGRSVWRMGNA